MAHPVAISDSSFENEVTKADKPVLVDFWAEWCGPCRMMAPVLEKISDEHPELKIAKLDVDHNPKTAGEFGVQSIPTLIVFKDGKEAERLIGYMPKEKLMSRLQGYIGEPAKSA
ncbi:MAG: thioredoxin [Chloroflexota bacterium]